MTRQKWTKVEADRQWILAKFLETDEGLMQTIKFGEVLDDDSLFSMVEEWVRTMNHVK